MMDAAWTWLTTPLSGAATHDPAPWAYWHARLMVLSWTILLPVGMAVARYLKVTPGQDWPARLDNAMWWRAHVHLQVAGVVVTVAGVGLAYVNAGGASTGAQVHHWLGWVVVAMLVVQVAGGWFRGTKGGPTDTQMRGDHYDMTRRRIVFEHLHKRLGWLAVPLAIAATAVGLVEIDAPRWMPLVLGAWWVGFALACLAMQRAGWRVDTYLAIWGPDPAHPGNARRAILHGAGRRRGTTLP